MSLCSLDGAVVLEGHCGLEEAEALTQLLLQHPNADIDWGRLQSAHTAIIQILVVAKRTMRGLPQHDLLREHVAAVLDRQT